MQATCVHRGPDDAGEWHAGGVAFAHRRLSIIDLSERGRQPMCDGSGQVVICYNGEVYNYLTLRGELLQQGYSFHTSTDTEVILNGYLAWGLEGVLARCDGMFAFLLYDGRSRTVYACRDRFGEKPLYYYAGPQTLLFASELSALWQVCGELSLDFESLDYYLTELSIPQPKTIWRQILQVRPGHYLSVELSSGRLSEQPYWAPAFAPKLALSEEDAIRELDRLLTAAVLKRTVGNRPVGAFLSGGVDSGLVVSILARHGSGRVRTFSMGFAGLGECELPQARRVAARYATEHAEVLVRPAVAELLPLLVEHFGEPFADSSSIPAYYVAREIKRHVTVALSGDGGDEIFGGYYEYALSYRAERFERGIRSRWLRKAARLWSALMRRLRVPVDNYGLLDEYLSWPGARRLYRQMGFDPSEKLRLYEPGLAEARPDFAARLLEQVWKENAVGSPTDTLFASSLRTRLPNDYLVKMDRVSMMNSLEVRAPFLDRDLTEFAAQLPNSLKLKGGTTKYLLRVLAARYVDPEGLQVAKRGFSIPLASWLRGDLREFALDYICSDRFAQRGLFNAAYVRDLADRHMRGGEDHAHRLWALLCLELWFRRFVDEPRAGR